MESLIELLKCIGMDKLSQAIERQDVEEVKSLIEAGDRLSSANLSAAVRIDNAEIVRLCTQGSPSGINWKKIILSASQNGKWNTMSYYLEQFDKDRPRDGESIRTILAIRAITQGNDEVFQAPYLTTVKHKVILNILIKHGSVNMFEHYQSRIDEADWPLALRKAVKYNREKLIDYCLPHVPEGSICENDIVRAAIISDNIELVKRFESDSTKWKKIINGLGKAPSAPMTVYLEGKCGGFTRTFWKSYLSRVSCRDDIEAVKLALAHNLGNKAKYSALMNAAQHGRLENCLLLDEKDNSHLYKKDVPTFAWKEILHLAVRFGQLDIINTFSSRVQEKEFWNMMAFVAVREDNVDLMKLLEKQGVDTWMLLWRDANHFGHKELTKYCNRQASIIDTK